MKLSTLSLANSSTSRHLHAVISVIETFFFFSQQFLLFFAGIIFQLILRIFCVWFFFHFALSADWTWYLLICCYEWTSCEVVRHSFAFTYWHITNCKPFYRSKVVGRHNSLVCSHGGLLLCLLGSNMASGFVALAPEIEN